MVYARLAYAIRIIPNGVGFRRRAPAFQMCPKSFREAGISRVGYPVLTRLHDLIPNSIKPDFPNAIFNEAGVK